MLPSQEKIEEIIKALAKIMRIQDWDIALEYCGDRRMEELSGGYNYACCERNLRLHYATIYINKDHSGVDEWYETVVHELYHIVTNDWHYHAISLLDFISNEATRDKERNMLTNYYEKTIEDMSRGFVNAYPVTNFIKDEVAM